MFIIYFKSPQYIKLFIKNVIFKNIKEQTLKNVSNNVHII
jgi:hypothetical protein